MAEVIAQLVPDLYVFVTTTKNGKAAIVNAEDDRGTLLPLITFDLGQTEKMKKIAQDVASGIGRDVRLMKYTQAAVVEAIQPQKIVEVPDGAVREG